MNLLSRALTRGWNRIAFIGLTKHAGKTTALNGLVAQADARRVPLGLCSIGLDGERLDTILGVEKPAIHAPAGTVVASAERALEQSDATFEWLEQLPIESPLGTIMLARVTSPGRVVLAGVRQRSHVRHVLPRLQEHGARLSLVDGAFDRIAAAAPQLVDAAVIAVGAVAGKTIPAVVDHAYPLIRRFCLPVCPDDCKAVLESAYRNGHIGLAKPDGLTELDAHQALYGLPRLEAWDERVDRLYLPGALTNEIAGSLRLCGHPLHVVVSHPAQILLSADACRDWFRAGHRLSVWNAMPVLAIAANPHSMSGYDLPKQELVAALEQIAGDIPVYDALAEGVWTDA